MIKKRIIYSLCVLTTMIAIFCFSSQTYDETMKTSDVIVKPIENSVKKDSSNFETEKDENSYLKNLEDKLDLAVRKSAHICIYGLLSLFVYLLCKSLGLNDADAIVLSLAFCALYGGSDELHQRFVDGRKSLFTDACVDEMGAVISVVITRIVIKIKEKYQYKN